MAAPTLRADQVDISAEFSSATRSVRLAAPGNGLSGGLGSGYSVNEAYGFDFTNFQGTLTGELDANSQVITGVPTPTIDSHAVNKAYADAIAGGFDPKESADYATAAALASYTGGGTATLTASGNGALTVDGTAVADGDRVLVKDETTTDAVNNLVYDVTDKGSAGTPWILDRASDFDSDAEVTNGAFLLIVNGSANGGAQWFIVTPDPITLGSTEISWSQAGTAVVAGAGMTKSGSTLNVIATDTSITVDADDLGVNLNSASGLEISTGLKILLDTTPGLELSGTGLTAIVAANGGLSIGANGSFISLDGVSSGLQLAAGGLSIKLDAASLSLSSSGLRVANLGVDTAQLAAGAVTEAKLGVRDQVEDFDATVDFSYSAVRSTATIAATPLVGTNLLDGLILCKNGQDGMARVTTTGAVDEWSISGGTTLSVHGDITADTGDVYRLRYKIAS
jgi:hypothetical protein